MKTTIKKLAAAVCLLSLSLWGQTTAVDAGHQASGVLPVAHGGTGTSTPSLVQGTNVTISGTWPNQTINSSGGGSGSVTLNTIAPLLGGTTGATQTITFAASLLTAAYGGNGNGTSDNSAAFTADCAANGQVYLPLGAFALTSNYTIPCPVVFGAGATVVAPNAVTVTLSYCPIAAPIKIFTLTGTGAVTYVKSGCSASNPAYAEWWGATGSSGTPTDQLRINACLAGGGFCQLLGKGYYLNGSVVPISGAVLSGLTNPVTSLNYNQATGNIVALDGLIYVTIENMAIARTVAGSSGASGISNGSGSQFNIVRNVTIEDNPNGIYFNGSPNDIVEKVTFTYSSVSSTSVTQYAINMNGSQNSGSVHDSFVLNQAGASLHVYGSYGHGTGLNDVWFYNFQCTLDDYCHYLDGSGGGAGYVQDDIHFINTVCDQSRVTCFYISGVTAARSSAVEVLGGYAVNLGGNTSPGIDIENSYGVLFDQTQIPQDITGAIKVNGGGGNIFRGMLSRSTSSPMVQLIGTSNNILDDLQLCPSVSGQNGVALTSGSTHNIIKSIVGACTSSGTGLSADSTSNYNQFSASDVSTFTTSYSDAGTGNLWNGIPGYATLTDASTVAWALIPFAATNNAQVTLGGNRTLSITGAFSGNSGTLWVKQDATGSRTLTLPSGSKVVNGGGGTCTLSTAANALDILTWTYNGTNYAWTCGLNFN